MKVIDLAKQLGTSPKELIRFLGDVDIKVKSPNTKLAPDLVEEIKTLFKGETPEDKANEIRTIVYNEPVITIQKLAELGDLKLGELMHASLSKGLLVNLNSEIDIETAQGIVEGFNVVIEVEGKDDDDEGEIRSSLSKIEEEEVFENPDALVNRPPVITIMGHVDHGKTFLLDTIRKSNVVSGEAGGITQHIGAYQVEVDGKKLTFLDTPGHAAFTALRARGAQVTDIVILVVASNEGVKPQTIEAIDHALAAKVPIIVAINKMDLPDANPDMVKQALSQHNILVEDWGGEIVCVPLSAKTGEGIDTLLEMISLVSDVQDLKANADRLAKAVVIESHLSRQKGPIATVLVKTGTLRSGDHFLIDSDYGKVRALHNDRGETVTDALPGTPVELLGISAVPSPGSILEAFSTEKEAKKVADERSLAASKESAQKNRPVSLENLATQMDDEGPKQLNLVIKADVNGSLEAIVSSIAQLDTGNVAVQVIHSATGDANENDVMLALASGGIVICFNVGLSQEAKKLSERESVDVKRYTIIYEILDDIKRSLDGMFTPEFEERETGRLTVRQLFKFSKVGVIAGSYVTDGEIRRGATAQVLRGGEEIYKGTIDSLKRFKDDVKEVKTGFECGVVLDNYNDFQEDDVIVAFELFEKNKA